MKNPHALVIFGQKYDGSNEVSIVPPIAKSDTIGCVMPIDKTDDMSQGVGIDRDGRLYTNGVTVDNVVTAFSDNPVSSNGVYVYVSNNTEQINKTIQQVRIDVTQTSDKRYNELRGELTNTEKSIEELRTSAISRLDEVEKSIESTNQNVAKNASDILALQQSNVSLDARVDATEQNIGFNRNDINALKPRVEQVETDLTEVKSRNIGYYFSSESAILAWLSKEENTKLLGVGVCLYITGNTSVHYVWNGTSADRVVMLTEVVGGYMTNKNPTGEGSIAMNENQVATDSAAFGRDNIAENLYTFVAGHGVKAKNDSQAVVGRYNAESKDDEMFSVGAGQNDKTRQTVHTITESGYSKSTGDVTAFDTELNAPISTDKSKVAVSCSITNKQSNVDVKVDWDSFITIITRNDAGVYNFVYKDGHWSSDSYNFAYIAQQETYYYPIDVVDISFVYNDGTEGKPTITFVDNDTITVHAPLQKTISLRELYNTVSELYQYVHKES